MTTVEVHEAWNGPGRGDGELTNVRPEHNALHARTQKLAFEHWYFDAHLDNGYTVVGFLIKRRPEDPPLCRPWVEIIIYRPDGTRRQLSQKYPRKAARFSERECDVAIGPNTATVAFGDDGLPTYTVHFEEEDVVLDLEFRNEIKPWMPGRGETEFGDGGVFGWCVGAPRAAVSGTVSIDGQTLAVTGRGYADHNWGVGDMRSVIERWHWGRLYTDEYTLLYAIVATQEKYGSLQIKPVMLARGDEVLMSTGEVDFREGPIAYDDTAGRDFPTSITIDAPGRFSLTLDVRDVLHAEALLDAVPVLGSRLLRPLAERLVGRPGYFRFHSDFTLSVTLPDGTVDVATGSTLHELVALR